MNRIYLMSIVVNVITSSCSWVAFDGRAQCDGKITTEFQEKAIMINRNVCLGYTGTLEFAQQVIQNLKRHVVGVSEMKSDIIAYAIRELLSMAKSQLPDIPIVNFLITGINSSNKLATYTLGTKFPIHEHIPSEYQCLCTALYSAQNTLDFPSYIQQKMKSGFLTEAMVITEINNYITAVAQIDPSVNTNITHMKIAL